MPHASLERLPPKLQSLLRTLRERLDTLYGERLHSLILYGSYARGEATDASDVDIMVVLRGEVDRLQEIERLSHEIYPMVLEHGELISVFPVSEQEHQSRRTPLLITARREGIAI